MNSSILFREQENNSAKYNTTVAADLDPLLISDWVIISLELIIMVLTILANLLVMLCIFIVKSLRKPHNYLLLSLAAADLLVGVIVMPLSILLQIERDRWPLGTVLCDIFVSVDVVCCCASIFNMTAIALDRYVAIKSPFYYKVRATLQAVFWVLCLTWLLAILITLPTLFTFGVDHFDADDPSAEICAGSTDSWAHLIAVTTAGILPWAILMFVYSKIVQVLIKQKRKDPSWKHRANIPKLTGSETADELQKFSGHDTNDQLETSSATICGKLFGIIRDNKGCAMLGLVMLAYVLCWFPFFFVTFMTAVSHIFGNGGFYISGWTYQRLVWLGYVNSAVNPFIYAIFMPEFRQSVKDILMCRCSGMEARVRAANYESQTKQVTSSSLKGNGAI